MKEMERVYLLLGTNLGDLKRNLLRALEELAKNNIKIIKRSRLYKTRPWGKSDQPDFLNMAVEVESPFSPEELLKIIKGIEGKMERIPTERWGPRIIDIDILFYGRCRIKKPGLEIPHPEFFNRPFALIPMAEIAPDFIPPDSDKRIEELIPEGMDEGVEVYCR